MDNLKSNQQQLDLDGCMVGVSRQALEEVLYEIEQLRAWISDLQSGLYVNCVYCGHRYGPGETTPVSMADALKAHVEQCSKHPMSALKVENNKLLGVATAAADLVENIAERGYHDNWKATANALRVAGLRK